MFNRIAKHFVAVAPTVHSYECDCESCRNCDPDPSWEQTATGWLHKPSGTTIDVVPPLLQPPDFDISHCPTVGSVKPLVPLDARSGQSPFDYLAAAVMVAVLAVVAVGEAWRAWRGM